MSTLAALERYDSLCDELQSYMHEENEHLRASGCDEFLLVERKQEIIGKLEGALEALREAGPVRSTEHAASAEVRKKVLAKIMKLLLLSRESEQLLLKNSMGKPTPAAAPRPTAVSVAATYKTRKSAARQPAAAPTGSTQAEGSWSVW
jgi:hypothetical protein